MPEKHLASHSAAQVGKLFPVLPYSAFSGCWGNEFSIDVQHHHFAQLLTFQILNCAMYFQEPVHMGLFSFLEVLFSFLGCGFGFV